MFKTSNDEIIGRILKKNIVWVQNELAVRWDERIDCSGGLESQLYQANRIVDTIKALIELRDRRVIRMKRSAPGESCVRYEVIRGKEYDRVAPLEGLPGRLVLRDGDEVHRCLYIPRGWNYDEESKYYPRRKANAKA